jgi:methylmalonyl-CoA mutase cobalamin-binding subunit
MKQDTQEARSGNGSYHEDDGIRFLVESALRSVASHKNHTKPASRSEWIQHLCDALIADSDTAYRSVVSDLVLNGFEPDDIYQSVVPDAARKLGEMWLYDEATFVEVTTGASRLQGLLRERKQDDKGFWMDRSIPLGQSILLVIPQFEDHSLGAFVAADQFRRHGIWVHLAISLESSEVVKLVAGGRFAMVGFTLSTGNSLDKMTDMVSDIRAGVPECPPLIIGGNVVDQVSTVADQTGATYAVGSVREAIERCSLASVAEPLSSELTF